MIGGKCVIEREEIKIKMRERYRNVRKKDVNEEYQAERNRKRGEKETKRSGEEKTEREGR